MPSNESRTPYLHLGDFEATAPTLLQWRSLTGMTWLGSNTTILSSLSIENTCQLLLSHCRQSTVMMAADVALQARLATPGSLGAVRHRCLSISQNSCLQNLDQENAYPWIAALIMDEDSSSDYVNTKCSGTLVIFSTCIY